MLASALEPGLGLGLKVQGFGGRFGDLEDEDVLARLRCCGFWA